MFIRNVMICIPLIDKDNWKVENRYIEYILTRGRNGLIMLTFGIIQVYSITCFLLILRRLLKHWRAYSA